MSKEPGDLGKKVEGEGNICKSCPFIDYPLSEHLLSECHPSRYKDCIHRAKIFYSSVFPKKVIISVEELRDFIQTQP